MYPLINFHYLKKNENVGKFRKRTLHYYYDVIISLSYHSQTQVFEKMIQICSLFSKTLTAQAGFKFKLKS